MTEKYPVLKGDKLFRKDELVYINRSDELQEYCGMIHRHDFIEIIYVIDGNGLHVVRGQGYETSKGDLFIINYDVPHGFFPKEKGSNLPIVYNCVFMPDFLDSSLLCSSLFKDMASSLLFKTLFPEDNIPYPDLTLRGTEFSEIGNLFSKMYAEYKLAKKGYCEIIRAYLIELIIKIFRYMDKKNVNIPASKNVELVNKSINYLKQNYNSDIRLEDLAMKSFISKNYFSKLFREIAGINFSDYIQQLRIDEACNLLKSTDMKIIDVASKVGFKDLKFFYKVFKKNTGKTPGEYRRRKV